jgi:hypothetical protein
VAHGKLDMLSNVKIRNVQRSEAILRIMAGAICIALAILIPGILRWILGLTGIALLVTAFFGY